MSCFIHLKSGERINPATFDNIRIVDDSMLPSARKSAASLAAYKKNMNVEPGTVNVPVAQFSEIPDYVPPSPIKQSAEYYKYIPREPEDYDNIVEYDYDDEDCNWLDLLNAERKKSEQVGYTEFEMVMDRLEKDCVFEIKATASMVAGSSAESDDVCCVCCDGETSNANQIIYCDMCNIAVHQDCYGVPYIPEGQWLCRKCKVSPASPVSCCLCPNTTGAFKQTSNGRWAHIICAIWLNEVHFGNAVFLEPIEGVDNSLKKRSKLKCLVCRQKMGACLQCSTRSCLKAFHATCAQNSGMSMKVITIDDPDVEEGMDVQRFIYCHLHSDDDASTDKVAKKKRMENAVRNARKAMAATSAGNTMSINMPRVSNAVIADIQKRVGFDITDIVEYWYLKRKSRCGAPLIRRIQLQLSLKRSAATEFMSPENKELYAQVHKMRIRWENTRLLCELVKKRELNKSLHVQMCHDIFRKVVCPLPAVLEDIVKQMFEKDKKEVFHAPVTVDGYRSVIKKPMDLSTILKKINDGKIESFDDLREDFHLMMENCDKFNVNSQWYLHYGKKFRKSGDAMIDEAEEEHNQREKIVGDSEMASAAAAVNFMEVLNMEEDGEGGVELRRTPRTRRGSASVAPQTPSGQDRKASLLETPATKKMGAVAAATPTSQKRKTSELFTPPTSRVKRSKKEDAATPKQALLTRFFPPARPELRSSTTTASTTPLMAYRDNSAIRSPLPADIGASSESSADEEDGRRNRRSARLLEHTKVDSQSDSESTFIHNDLVSVDGTAGRVIDPAHALLEDHLPKQLISECRSSRRDTRVCVMLFGTENKWGWYPISEIKLMNLSGDNDGVSTASQRLAKQWYKKTVETYR